MRSHWWKLSQSIFTKNFIMTNIRCFQYLNSFNLTMYPPSKNWTTQSGLQIRKLWKRLTYQKWQLQLFWKCNHNSLLLFMYTIEMVHTYRIEPVWKFINWYRLIENIKRHIDKKTSQITNIFLTEYFNDANLTV